MRIDEQRQQDRRRGAVGNHDDLTEFRLDHAVAIGRLRGGRVKGLEGRGFAVFDEVTDHAIVDVGKLAPSRTGTRNCGT